MPCGPHLRRESVRCRCVLPPRLALGVSTDHRRFAHAVLVNTSSGKSTLVAHLRLSVNKEVEWAGSAEAQGEEVAEVDIAEQFGKRAEQKGYTSLGWSPLGAFMVLLRVGTAWERFDCSCNGRSLAGPCRGVRILKRSSRMPCRTGPKSGAPIGRGFVRQADCWRPHRNGDHRPWCRKGPRQAWGG